MSNAEEKRIRASEGDIEIRENTLHRPLVRLPSFRIALPGCSLDLSPRNLCPPFLLAPRAGRAATRAPRRGAAQIRAVWRPVISCMRPRFVISPSRVSAVRIDTPIVSASRAELSTDAVPKACTASAMRERPPLPAPQPVARQRKAADLRLGEPCEIGAEGHEPRLAARRPWQEAPVTQRQRRRRDPLRLDPA